MKKLACCILAVVFMLGSEGRAAWDMEKVLQAGADVVQAVQQQRQIRTAADESATDTTPDSDFLNSLLNAYKEKYKEEGRQYARELGDILVERVREDRQIQSSIRSVQALCWGVIAYLTVVTLVMLACLLHLKRVNTRLLAAVAELQQRPPH